MDSPGDDYRTADMWIGMDPSYSGFGFIGLIPSDSIPGGLGTLQGHTSFAPTQFGRDGARLSRIFNYFVRFLGDLSHHYRIRGVAIEGYAPSAKFNRELLGELGGIIRLAVHEALHEVCPPPLIVSPSSLKKFATGKGNVPKDNVMLAVYKKWDAEFTSNDLADAYTLARIAYAVDNGADLEYEKAVLVQLIGTVTQ
jgi:Holliday junction resolvasome RuvABC endonuclease subunit